MTMLRWTGPSLAGLAVASLIGLTSINAVSAQDASWRIGKVSGEAWLANEGAAPVSVAKDASLRPGDTVRTGRNGRVLLLRGAETIMVSPNSSISVPENGRSGMSTIIQQAGTIVLDVEKKNIQHFEVETPFLAAVVKGTSFKVSIERSRARVDVVRGQVQVSDFKSGQFALVAAGQTARVAPASGQGLKLSGAGTLARIEQGQPQAARVAPLPVPQGGLTAAPKAAPSSSPAAASVGDRQQSRAPVRALEGRSSNRAGAMREGLSRGDGGSPRLAAPLGEVRLDIHRVTRGLARAEGAGRGSSAPGMQKASVWSTGELHPGNHGNKGKFGKGRDADGAAPGSGRVASTPAGAALNRGYGGRDAGFDQSPGGGNRGNNAGGNDKSNAGGNGKDNGGGNGNSNAGGNGKGNAGGNGNSNAGGNGKSNAGGNGNSNAGGNGSNAGGNGNGSTGGKGGSSTTGTTGNTGTTVTSTATTTGPGKSGSAGNSGGGGNSGGAGNGNGSGKK